MTAAFVNTGAMRRSSENSRIRVMVIDDSVTVRAAFSRMVSSHPDLHLVCQVGSAEEALSKINKTPCDVILLDLEMPGMGGIKALPHLLAAECEPQILVVSSLTREGAEHSVQALANGAADTMLKPGPGGFGSDYTRALIDRILALGGVRLEERQEPTSVARAGLRQTSSTKPRALAIGASTGGIHAMNTVLRALPDSFDMPILVAQHLPASFIPVFVKQLEAVSGRATVLAECGSPLQPGTIIVAPGHAHLAVSKKYGELAATLDHSDAKSGCTPSVDPLFSSLAEATGGAALGLVLSGMGRDGCEGAQQLYEAGGTILAQDATSSAVWGMPRAVVEAGLASFVGNPEQLAYTLASYARVPA